MQYSKIIPIVTCLIFMSCLYVVFTSDYSSAFDTTIYATCVTVSGGIFGTTILFYYKKALGENLIKVRIGLYKETSQERLRYNRAMMKLKNDYKMDDIDIAEIENEFVLKEKMDGVVSDADARIDMSMVDAESIEQQNY